MRTSWSCELFRRLRQDICYLNTAYNISWHAVSQNASHSVPNYKILLQPNIIWKICKKQSGKKKGWHDAQDDFSTERYYTWLEKVHKMAIIFNQENLLEKPCRDLVHSLFHKYRYWYFKYFSRREGVTSNKPEVSTLPSNS